MKRLMRSLLLFALLLVVLAYPALAPRPVRGEGPAPAATKEAIGGGKLAEPSAPSPLLNPDSYEPDDDVGHAKNIFCGNWQDHTIYPTADSDWVWFSLQVAATVTIETWGANPGDTVMWLYNSNPNKIAEDDDSGEGHYSRIVRALQPGTYYAQVWEYGNDHTIQYWLHLSAWRDPTLWTSTFGASTGWTSQDKYPRMLGDVNHDHIADVVGFGNAGTFVALSNGIAFGAPALWRGLRLRPGLDEPEQEPALRGRRERRWQG
jgi:hypothetical protein